MRFLNNVKQWLMISLSPSHPVIDMVVHHFKYITCGHSGIFGILQLLRAILMVPNVLDNYIGLEERIGLPLLIDSGGHE